MDEKEMSIEQYSMGQSIESIDRKNELMVIEPMLETEIAEEMGRPSEIKRVRQKKKRIINIKTTLLRHNASLNEVIKSSTIRYSLRCLDDNCVWRFHASKIVVFFLFQVNTYEKAHSGSVDFITSDHRNATSNIIYDYILELMRDSSNVITPNFMVDEMRRKYGIIISYNKGWRAIQHAYMVIRGTVEENYNRLPSYLHMVKENNLGTYTNIKRDDENRYKCYTVEIENFCLRGKRLLFDCTA
ncbi:hypothetical protein CQW23_29090 [Capsicum baccatum]|uniref:Uncharacterized protein n=1 Tax=Capsicum baccatum TaxID=33114 RepID=A0A2G2VIF7_CAPBA|nr:hypothetical protein CQW23_29090 [Capsicum baccatum]